MEAFEIDVQEMITVINSVYDESKAFCFGVNRISESENGETFEAKAIDSCGDVYDLIDEVAFKAKDLYSNFAFLVIATAGWAKPTNEDDEKSPSMSPNRKRVYLYNVISKDRDIASAIVFGGDIETIIIDTNKDASGPLMDNLLKI